MCGDGETWTICLQDCVVFAPGDARQRATFCHTGEGDSLSRLYLSVGREIHQLRWTWSNREGETVGITLLSATSILQHLALLLQDGKTNLLLKPTNCVAVVHVI